jgi:hypothetical protein
MQQPCNTKQLAYEKPFSSSILPKNRLFFLLLFLPPDIPRAPLIDELFTHIVDRVIACVPHERHAWIPVDLYSTLYQGGLHQHHYRLQNQHHSLIY